MHADHPQDPVSRLELERWALGRLEPERVAALEAISQDDPDLLARMERVRDELARAAEGLPAFELPDEDEAPAQAPAWAWLRRPLFVALPLAAAVAVALFFALPPTDTPPHQAWRGGMVDLELFRVRLGEPAQQGALVQGRVGDRLQYTITPSDAGWLQVYNLQDDGRVQAYLEPRQVAGKQPVESAVVLDDYPGTERIFFLLSAEPLGLEAFQLSAQQAFHTPLVELDRLSGLGDALTQRSVLVIKEASP